MSTQSITVSGAVHLLDFDIPNIVGGFGNGKKGVLAKTVAEVHGKKTDEVNRAVDRNRERFVEGVDVINIKPLKNLLTHLMSQQILSQDAVNRSKNIYLFSERGYFKLAKIMDDDTSWDVIETLIEGYFRGRTGDRNIRFPLATELRERLALIESKRRLSLSLAKAPAEARAILHKSLYEICMRLGEVSPNPDLEHFFGMMLSVYQMVVFLLVKSSSLHRATASYAFFSL